MEGVPFTWRARKGYICHPAPAPAPEPEPEPAPEPEPEPEPTPPPPQEPATANQIMVSHNYYVVVPQPAPLAYAAQIYQAAPPISLVTAPAPTVSASNKAPSVAASNKAPSVAASNKAPPSVAKSTKSTTSSKKSNASSDEGSRISPPPQPPAPAPASEPPASAPPTSEATTLVEEPPKHINAPPSLLAGTNYMFPAEHTKLHIFNKSSKVWEDKHAGKSFNFKIFKVATTFTPKMVIENVLKGAADAGRWAITEVVEKGDGAWAKGTTIEYAGERAGCSLSSMGWTGKRGTPSMPPVWVVVHKV